MNRSTAPDRSPSRRTARRAGIAGVALAAGVTTLPGLAATAGAAPAASTGTVITTAATSWGRALVVGSGPLKGYSLYFITSDHGHTFGCTTQPVKLGPGNGIQCTGPSTDNNVEWPAMTTSGAPVAAGGAHQNLLGTVHRAGVGDQVTYAGHPLYLFDSGPGQVTGEGWDEPGLPPWHGIWNLLAPNGKARVWAGTLTTMTIGGAQVLATPMITLAGWVDFPVYRYSRDTSHDSRCTGACARAWPPMLTDGSPGVTGTLSAGNVGHLSTAEGTQVTYGGKPLYLFAYETPTLTGAGLRTTGNGNGVKVAGGRFSLVRA